MKALVKRAPGPGIFLEDVPVPQIKSDEVLIQPLKTSICGTDIHIYKWDAWAQKTVPTPLVIGHEFMGKVVEVGSDVKNVSVGEKVSGEGHITCGVCPNCLANRSHLCPKTQVIGIHTHGCFADYFPLKATNVFKIPEGVSDEVAAIFDPLGNAVHSALSFNLADRDVLITGAGPIGIMAAGIAKHLGARNVIITDVNEVRLKLAKKMGATATVNVHKENLSNVMETLGIQEGFAVALEMSGSPQALTQSLETLQPGGKLGLLGLLPPGISIDWNLVIFKMLTLKGIYGRQVFKTWEQMAQMLQEGLDVEPVVTHRYPIEDFQKGFDVMMKGESGKVILEWVDEEAVGLEFEEEEEAQPA
ncbi:MAG: L-threonine 3-dehydrogenase [Chlamydiae bacterium]|nr:L-threonine 3-dehydrogenase [Chlamydiota bacterium]